MNYIKVVLTVCMVIVFGGCRMVDEPIEIDILPIRLAAEPVIRVDQGGKSQEQRFTEETGAHPGAVQSALMWSQKYDDLTVKTEKLKDINDTLTKENAEFRQQTTVLKLDLDQTKKELNEANNFLQDMHLELNKWKSDVLGFRDEIRRAQAAELEALSRILRVLGAEPAITDEETGQ